MKAIRNRRLRAVSLVEAVIASTVLAFAVAAVAAALLAGTQQSYEAIQTRRAAELAEAMIEEVIALPYDDPDGASALGPEAGESGRTDFDNVDDYHNYAEAAGSIVDAAGSAYPQPYAAFARTVSIATASLQPTGFGTAVSGLSLTVTVDLAGRTLAAATRFVPDPDPS